MFQGFFKPLRRVPVAGKEHDAARVAVKPVHRRDFLVPEGSPDDARKRVVKYPSGMVHGNSRRLGKHQKFVVGVKRIEIRGNIRFRIVFNPVNHSVLWGKRAVRSGEGPVQRHETAGNFFFPFRFRMIRETAGQHFQQRFSPFLVSHDAFEE